MNNKKLMIMIVSLILALTISVCTNGSEESTKMRKQIQTKKLAQVKKKLLIKTQKWTTQLTQKWVIHEEFPEAGEELLEPGTEAVTDAAHMEGMKGATAEIDSAEKTTVYMIDFTPTTGGEKVTNHKWVTESELSPPKSE